jgi:hypothetical protein
MFAFSSRPGISRLVLMNPTVQTLQMNAVAVPGHNTAMEHFFQGLVGLGMLLGVSLLDFLKRPARTE